MIFFDNCDVLVNQSGIVATNVAISSRNSVSPMRVVGKKGAIGQNPAGEIQAVIQISYYPEIDNEPIYALSKTIKALQANHTGIQIEIGGITGYNCFLTNYSLNAVPNELVRATASFVVFTPLSGDLRKKDGTVVYNQTNSLMHSWTTYVISTSGFSLSPTRELNYDFSVDWMPIFGIGRRTPKEVKLLHGNEKFSFLKDDFINVTFSGEDVFKNVIDTDNIDYTADFINAALICRQYDGAIRFAAIGDYGSSGSGEASIANVVKTTQPNFIITLGDNNYESGLISTIDKNIGRFYGEYIGGYTGVYGQGSKINRFFPCIGNHDSTGNIVTSIYADNYAPYLSFFPQLPSGEGNGRYYDFQKGPVALFCINSDLNEPNGHSTGDAQIKWLRFMLKTSTAAWNVVYFHHPAHSSEIGYASNWMSGLALGDWGAHVVLNGHAHDYERIQKDIPYIVCGVGGASLRGFGNPVQGSVFRHSGEFGALIVDADAQILDIKFINEYNVIVDRCTLHKTGIFDSVCSKMQLDISGSIVTESELTASVGDMVSVKTIATRYF
jgi:tartrate-resistant acid phosphatase type 5